jgi:hypothetical protein
LRGAAAARAARRTTRDPACMHGTCAPRGSRQARPAPRPPRAGPRPVPAPAPCQPPPRARSSARAHPALPPCEHALPPREHDKHPRARPGRGITALLSGARGATPPAARALTTALRHIRCTAVRGAPPRRDR